MAAARERDLVEDILHTGETVELLVGGMTCASCAARVQRRLGRLPGVDASVNYATERATVHLVEPDAAPADPGKPGMLTVADLVREVEAAGYTAAPLSVPPGRTDTADEAPSVDALEQAEQAEAADTRRMRRRMWVSTALAIPVIVLAMVPPAQFPGWQWASLALATPVVAWGGLPFHRATWRNLRHGAATMDTLITLGTLAAFVWSLYSLVFGDAGRIGLRDGFDLTVERGMSGTDTVYFEVAAGVTVFLLVGRYLELRSRRRAGAALRALLEHGAKEVTVLDADGTERLLPASALAVGDLFVVRPGERVATDGVVTDGAAAIDTSLVTGESVPVDVAAGAAVTGGTVAAGGRLVVRATRVGADTQLAQMARMLAAAQGGKAEIARLADRVSAVFVPVVLLLALATLGGWLLAGGAATVAWTAAVAVLIVACPCALGLATPMALLVGTGRGAQLGILIRGPEVLESTRRAQVVVLDKTGTLTTGRMSVAEVHPAAGESAAEVLRLAGAVEAASEHPIARAVAAAAGEARPRPAVGDFAALPGLGATGVVEGRRVLVGQARLLAEQGVPVDGAVATWQAEAERGGRTVVLVAFSGGQDAVRVRGAIAVADTVRPSARGAVAALRDLGLRPMLVTGDAAPVAHAVADEVGIEQADVIAGVTPAGKVDAVRALQEQGLVVAMVGDGVNDAPALAQSNLGLAMGSGSDVAIEAGDLVLTTGDPMAAVDAIRLSRATLRTIRGNLFWAFAYNVAALPVAAAGLLNPMIAGAAMAASSLFVVSNSLRLRRFVRHRVA